MTEAILKESLILFLFTFPLPAIIVHLRVRSGRETKALSDEISLVAEHKPYYLGALGIWMILCLVYPYYFPPLF